MGEEEGDVPWQPPRPMSVDSTESAEATVALAACYMLGRSRTREEVRDRIAAYMMEIGRPISADAVPDGLNIEIHQYHTLLLTSMLRASVAHGNALQGSPAVVAMSTGFGLYCVLPTLKQDMTGLNEGLGEDLFTQRALQQGW